MCMYYGIGVKNGRQKAQEERLMNPRRMTCYKVLRVQRRWLFWKRLVGPYQTGFVIKPGQIVSDRPTGVDLTMDEQADYVVSRGIHVFCDIASATSGLLEITAWGKGITSDYRIVEVQCHTNNLVSYCWNGNKAVFTRVTLSEEEYERALNK